MRNDPTDTNARRLMADAQIELTMENLNEYNIRNTNNWHIDDSGTDR
jgi:hypothetical protein